MASAAGETERMMPPPGARHWLPTWTETRLKRSSGTSRKRRSVSESSSAEPSGQMRPPWPVRPSAKVPSSENVVSPRMMATVWTSRPSVCRLPLTVESAEAVKPLRSVMWPSAVSSLTLERKSERALSHRALMRSATSLIQARTCETKEAGTPEVSCPCTWMVVRVAGLLLSFLRKSLIPIICAF